MNFFEEKVVPFERPASYWQKKARKAYRPDRMPEAARLMRKALEQGGDSHTALELAAIYRSMLCISAAERYLMKAAAEGGLTPQLCYETGLCALERQEEAMAEDALDACIRLSPGSALAHECQEILENYAWSYQAPEKRTARSLAMSHFARTRLQKGDVQGARERAEAAWKRGKTGEAAVLFGMLQPTPRQAEPYVKRATEKLAGQTPPILLLSQVYFQQGKTEAARQAMQKCAALCLSLQQVEAFSLMAAQMGFYDEALSLAESKLKMYPCSTDYLLIKYRMLKKLGKREQADRVLQTILEIDPDDACGLWYARHPEEDVPYLSRMMFLPILGMMTSSLRRMRKRGPLNRLLHLFAFALREEAAPEMIYAMIVPLWRKLSGREKKLLDDRDENAIHWLYLYVLVRLGKKERFYQLISSMPGRRRAERKVAQYLYLTQEG